METVAQLLMLQKKLFSIVGPTAVGKTRVAIQLAQALQTEIISADSRQFYREVSIGTAKPTVEELATVPHHFIGHVSVDQTYTAGDFERDALAVCIDLFKKYDSLVLCGGSGLYVKALTEGLDSLPAGDEALRKELRLKYEEYGIRYLQDRLRAIDATAYAHAEQQNPQRLMRAIEIALSPNTHSEPKSKRPFVHIPIGLNMPRDLLYARINDRVDKMMQAGLLDEAIKMLPYRETYAMKTVGYAELFDYLDGKVLLEQAVDLIKQHSRNYAKKQITWFKKLPSIEWFHPDDWTSVWNYIQYRLTAEL